MLTEVDSIPAERCVVCNKTICTLDEEKNECKCDIEKFRRRIDQIHFLERKERQYIEDHWFLFKNKGYCRRCLTKCNEQGYCICQ